MRVFVIQVYSSQELCDTSHKDGYFTRSDWGAKGLGGRDIRKIEDQQDLSVLGKYLA